MVDFELSEECLRGRLLEAQWQLNAVRAAIAAKQVTRAEGDYAYQTAFNRYARALHRFSDLTVYGQHSVIPERVRTTQA